MSHTQRFFFRRKFLKYICFIHACTCIYAYNSFKSCVRCMREFMRGHLIGRNSDCPISGGGCSLRELKQRTAGWRPVYTSGYTCSRNMHEKRENLSVVRISTAILYRKHENTMITESGIRTCTSTASILRPHCMTRKEGKRQYLILCDQYMYLSKITCLRNTYSVDNVGCTTA